MFQTSNVINRGPAAVASSRFAAIPGIMARKDMEDPAAIRGTMVADLVRLLRDDPTGTITDQDLMGLGWTRKQINRHGSASQAEAQRRLDAEALSPQAAPDQPAASRGCPGSPKAPAGTSPFHGFAIREMLARNDEAMLRIDALQDDFRREVNAMKGRNAIIRDFIRQIEAAHR